MSGDINIILTRLDRFETKLDDMGESLREGAREFGGIEKVIEGQEKRLKSLENKFWGIVFLCLATSFGLVFKAILT